jgi:hypothetical protein
MMKTALGLPVMSKTWAKAREGLYASQTAIYISVILIASLAAYLYQLRTYTIFSCPADGYNTDRYLAYCNGANYADYDHGSFQFDLEPSVQDFARNADVLFLGNSRLQVAFSTAATADWFSAASARYYLMGFGYFENVIFAEELLRKIRPRARVYVINVDDFFERTETIPVKTILHDPQARHRYEVKRLWQHVHEPICKTFTVLCGHEFVIFRSRETGAYHTEGAVQQKPTPVSYDQVISQNVVNSNTAAAIDFLSHFTQGKCVILTMVPFVGTNIGNANAIVKRLGMKLMTPGNLEGLRTYDGYHLDQPSAARWSQAFFQAAGSTIRSCLEEQGVAHPIVSSHNTPPT